MRFATADRASSNSVAPMRLGRRAPLGSGTSLIKDMLAPRPSNPVHAGNDPYGPHIKQRGETIDGRLQPDVNYSQG